jgi:hypothetical protein
MYEFCILDPVTDPTYEVKLPITHFLDPLPLVRTDALRSTGMVKLSSRKHDKILDLALCCFAQTNGAINFVASCIRCLLLRSLKKVLDVIQKKWSDLRCQSSLDLTGLSIACGLKTMTLLISMSDPLRLDQNRK